MATIGLRYLQYSKYDDKGKLTGPKNFGAAVDCKVNIETNEAMLYGDDVLQESDTSFKKGTITLGVTNDADAVFADVLGHTISAESESEGEVVYNAEDVAPFVAIGRILPKLVGGVRQYKVEFLHRVKFKEPSTEEATKGESVEFKTPSIEGTISTLPNGDWRKTKTFDSYEAAKTYLDGLLTAAA